MQKSVLNFKRAAIFWLCVFSEMGHADLSPVKDYAPAVTQLQLLGEYFYSTSNYNSSSGNYTTLPSGASLTNYTGTGQVRTNMGRRQWSFFGDLQFSGTTAKGVLQTNSSANLSLAKVGTDFVLWDSFVRLIPEFSVQTPFNSIDFTNGSTAAIDEGVTEVAAKMNAELKFSWFTLGGYGGYDYRTGGRSSLVPYGGFAQINMSSVRVGAKISGYSSLTNDQDTNNYTYRTTWQYAADAGSQLFGAVNPQLLQVDGYLDYRPEREMTFSVGGGSSINGSNMANGWNVVAAFSYRFGGIRKRLKESEPVPEFKEQTQDGVDQSLFDSSEPDVTVERRGPRTSPNSDVKKSMDNAEMNLEIKTRSAPKQNKPEDE